MRSGDLAVAVEIPSGFGRDLANLRSPEAAFWIDGAMDSELGAGQGNEQVVGLAQDEQQQIAEGNATEPVVDGIGTDNPTQLNQGRLPQPVAAAQMSRAPMRAAGNRAQTWSDGSPVLAPTRVPEEDEPEEVAMISAIINRPDYRRPGLSREPAAV